MPTRCSERGGAWIALLAAAAFAGAIYGYMFLLAAVIVRILTVTESRRPCEVAPLEVFGVIADPARLPALIARVARIATALKVRAPTRIIVGLKPGPWVSTAPIRLQDGQVLPPGETLYLSPLELRALRSRELDAFIAHELGHFRAGSALHRALRAGDAPAAVHLPGRALAAAQFHGPRAPALPDGHQRQGLGAEARGRLDPPAG